MRLVRYGPLGEERPGMLDRDGGLRDLSYVLIDLGPEHLGPDDLDILRSIEPETLPPVEGLPRLAFPLARHGRIFLDGRPCDSLKLHGPATRPPEGAPPRLGLAAAVGAPGWAGAFMSVRVTSNDAWAALGPWLTAPERPPRLDRLTADGARLRFAAEARAHPLGAYPIAAQGDIIIVTADSLGGGALGIDGFGRQIGS